MIYFMIQSIYAAEFWWSEFNDPQLSALVEQGLKNAPDIALAQARVRQSQAMAQQLKQGYLPIISSSWSSNTQPQDALGFGFGFSSIEDLLPDMPGIEPTETQEEEEEEKTELFTSTTLGLRVDVPLDVWRKSISSAQAAEFEVLSTQQQRQGVKSALVQNIASLYWDVALCDENIRLITEQMQSAESLMEITVLRQQRSEATSLDVLQQEQQLLTIKAQMPVYVYQRSVALQSLAVLLGEDPSQFSLEAPILPHIDVLKLPSQEDLFQSRPEILSAQYNLEAAQKKEQAARKAFYPDFGVSGQVSRQSNRIDKEWNSIEAWGFGTSASLSLYQGGGKRAALDAAIAGVYAAEQTLHQQKLQIQQQVALAQSSEELQEALFQARKEQTEASQKAYEEARQSYLQGVTPFITLMAAQQSYQQAQMNLLQIERDRVSARVQHYVSLGGDWIQVLP
ncbi:MAG: hypothetical protein CMK59_02725 [Proteobacteria bacterium]|nr:hypothetical protein [Pseudomonadota bacterium]